MCRNLARTLHHPIPECRFDPRAFRRGAMIGEHMKRALDVTRLLRRLFAMMAFWLIAGVATSAAAQDGDKDGFPGTFSAKVRLASEYYLRGLSQTDDAPALQGGVDVPIDDKPTHSGYVAKQWIDNEDVSASSTTSNGISPQLIISSASISVWPTATPTSAAIPTAPAASSFSPSRVRSDPGGKGGHPV